MLYFLGLVEVDVREEGGEQWTPLHMAAEHGRHEMAFLLLEHGANPNAGTFNIFLILKSYYKIKKINKYIYLIPPKIPPNTLLAINIIII